MRQVLLCGIHKPKRQPMTPTERTLRWRKNHPERWRKAQADFVAKHPNYRRDYYRRKRA